LLEKKIDRLKKEVLELSRIEVVKVRKKEGETSDELVANYLKEKTS